MGYYIGLDGGSTYLKAALVGEGRVMDTMVHGTGIDNDGTAKKLTEELCRRNNLKISDIGGIMATGYSRKVLETADDDISEITAHAYGIRLTAPKEYHPGMIIDIGGQDSKIIYLDSNYTVKNFSMNDKCAAGTGKFMEVIAQILETTIDQVGPLSLESTSPCDINSTCVVFAQSEVISLVARKYDRRDILCGMHISMARRIIKMMKKSEKGGDILMTGGGALNMGASVGMGCGTCCGSGISAFLFGYLTTHTKGIRQSMRAFLSFYLGKVMAVTALCLAASLLGTQILDERGTLFGINVHLATEIVMGGMALWMIIAWFRERNRKRCASCSHCSEPHSSGGHPEQETNANALMLWTMGSLYGISPCAPLILMLGYAVTMPAYAAALTGTVFALSSAIVPTIFMLVLSGVLSPKIMKEMPEYLDWFRLAVYILLLVIVAAEFL